MQALDIGKCMVGCTAGLGVFVAEEWIGKIFEVQSLRQNHLAREKSVISNDAQVKLIWRLHDKAWSFWVQSTKCSCRGKDVPEDFL